ncbi:MAG: hypothetical protein IJ695_02130 [Butyrivibrio sp.]|nr:hypothetical protein [Butyrivibrio sp.]
MWTRGYKGERYIVTIPVGADTADLIDSNGYAGFHYLCGKFGMISVGSN